MWITSLGDKPTTGQRSGTEFRYFEISPPPA
jgi:hypothetical protein